MITIQQSPTLNKVLLDGNENEIKFHSDAGTDFYFKVEIKVNDALFSEKSISKDGAGNATLNLKRFYDAYFPSPEITFPSQASIVTYPELKVKIEVIIKELSVFDDGLSLISSLPLFYIVKSIKKDNFSLSNLSFLGGAALEVNASFVNGIVNFPLFVVDEEILISIKDSNGNLIDQRTQFLLESNVASLFIRLTALTIPAFTPYITVDLVPNARTDERLRFNVVDIQNKIYPIKTLRYRNNNGVLLQRYFTGQLSEDRNFNPKSYAQADKTNITYEVNESVDISLNTGTHHTITKEEFTAIARSPEVLFKLDGVWTRFTSQTKKVTRFVDNQYIYDTVLRFSQQKV